MCANRPLRMKISNLHSQLDSVPIFVTNEKKMKIRNVVAIIGILFQINGVLSFDPLTWSVPVGVGFLYGYRNFIKCKFVECCIDDHIPINVTELQRQLASRLYGQHIVQETVVRALRGYKATQNPAKALVMSFHGPTGTGKNYVSSIITSTFLKHGTKSKFFQLFSGSIFSQSRLEEHKEFIKNTLVETLQQCERSIFVFDEVHKMPEGLLEILQPFLDYAQPVFLEYKSRQIRLNSNKAIFIFLTNASGSKILDQMLKFWIEGKKRKEMKLHHFESLISSNAVTENGGFLNSSAIQSSLIDYYVPFLPLEEEHVKLCMRDAFESDEYPDPPSSLMEQDVLSTVIYGPPPYNIYATGGCKRLETKVNSARQIDSASAT
ncbi:torsin-1A-like [Venturia canescens]|uniref:torsin-1A-like n=1 Tax=Venturia canescens TaxID=32260 RepID=UPI001C9D3FFD|nr:torsin-1A-like [Venturia canescens]